MNMKPVLLIAAAALMLGVAGCDTSKYGQVEQGKVIAFDKDAQIVTVVHDTNIDPSNPKYDKMPPVVFKLPANPKGNRPAAQGRSAPAAEPGGKEAGNI